MASLTLPLTGKSTDSTWKPRLYLALSLRPPHVDCSSQLNLGQLIPANSVLSVLYLLLNLTNLTFMVHWLASVSGAGCKFTLKSFVLTAFNQAPRRVRTGSLTIARPPALITVSKSGFEPLGWSLGPTQKGLTWRKVNLCHTCVTIWIMEFCNLSEWGGKCLQGKAYSALVSLAFMLSSYTRVCISCVNTQGMSELMKSWSIYDSKKERKRESETVSKLFYVWHSSKWQNVFPTVQTYHIHPLRREDFDIVDINSQLNNSFHIQFLKSIILYYNYFWVTQ